MTRTENRRLVQGGGEVTVELHSGSCGLEGRPRRGASGGVNGVARYSDEAYKAFGRRCGRYIRILPRFPHVPDEVPPCKGRNKLRWYRGISALYPLDG